MHSPPIVFVGAYLLMGLAQIALVVAAFRTSTRLGVMALLVPVYVASFGNHRLATPRRVPLAFAWWLGLVAIMLAVVTSG